MRIWLLSRTIAEGSLRRYSPRSGTALGVIVLALSLIVSAPSTARADTEVPTPATGQLISLDMSECGVMYLGTAGSCIISLQTWMNWAVGHRLSGFMTPINGLYDQGTLKMVKAFQKKYVPEVTPNGAFGAKSRAALKRWFKQGAARINKRYPCNPGMGWGCDKGEAREGV